MTLDNFVTFRERALQWEETFSPLYKANKKGHLQWIGPSQDGIWYKPEQRKSADGEYVVYIAMSSH